MSRRGGRLPISDTYGHLRPLADGRIGKTINRTNDAHNPLNRSGTSEDHMKHKILKLPAVMEKIGCGKSSIYRKLLEESFPTPIKLGERSVGWLESEVDDWLDKQIELSRGKK